MAITLPSSIKFVVTDFDGVVTDNCVYVNPNGEMSRKINFKDIMAFSILKKNGYKIGIVSGERNSAIDLIAEKFNIDEVHQNIRTKLDIIKMIMEKYNLGMDEIIFIGDDVNDFASLNYIKYRVTVPDAVKEIKNIENIQITDARGGEGAFREVADALISA